MHFAVIFNSESVGDLLSTIANRIVITAPRLITLSDWYVSSRVLHSSSKTSLRPKKIVSNCLNISYNGNARKNFKKLPLKLY